MKSYRTPVAYMTFYWHPVAKTPLLYDNVAEHLSCRNNLYESLQEYGIVAHSILTAFNIFMKVDVNNEGKLKVQRPTSKAGDQIIFRAHMDMVIGLTDCSAKKTNN